MILETKYGGPPKPPCSIALVALGLKGWSASVSLLMGRLICLGLVGECLV